MACRTLEQLANWRAIGAQRALDRSIARDQPERLQNGVCRLACPALPVLARLDPPPHTVAADALRPPRWRDSFARNLALRLEAQAVPALVPAAHERAASAAARSRASIARRAPIACRAARPLAVTVLAWSINRPSRSRSKSQVRSGVHHDPGLLARPGRLCSEAFQPPLRFALDKE